MAKQLDDLLSQGVGSFSIFKEGQDFDFRELRK